MPKKSFYYICKLLKRSVEYRLIYEIGSEIMHSSRLDIHVHIPKEKKLGIKPIRDFSEFGDVYKSILALAFHTYRIVINHYRPDERSRLNKKIKDDWLKAYQAKIEIEYDVNYKES